MTNPPKEKDPWRILALGMALILFLAGLAPEPIFYILREIGGVTTQRALVNSPYLITVALAIYFALFCFHSCVHAGLSFFQAQDRALQVGVLALLAFLPIDIITILAVHENPLIQARFAIYLAGITKLLAWWYLVVLFIRYYAFKDDTVFARIPSVFPSTHSEGPQATTEKETHAIDTQPSESVSSVKPDQQPPAPSDEDVHTSWLPL